MLVATPLRGQCSPTVTVWPESFSLCVGLICKVKRVVTSACPDGVPHSEDCLQESSVKSRKMLGSCHVSGVRCDVTQGPTCICKETLSLMHLQRTLVVPIWVFTAESVGSPDSWLGLVFDFYCSTCSNLVITDYLIFFSSTNYTLLCIKVFGLAICISQGFSWKHDW